jgi:hypothetical protein
MEPRLRLFASRQTELSTANHFSLSRLGLSIVRIPARECSVRIERRDPCCLWLGRRTRHTIGSSKMRQTLSPRLRQWKSLMSAHDSHGI